MDDFGVLHLFPMELKDNRLRIEGPSCCFHIKSITSPPKKKHQRMLWIPTAVSCGGSQLPRKSIGWSRDIGDDFLFYKCQVLGLSIYSECYSSLMRDQKTMVVFLTSVMNVRNGKCHHFSIKRHQRLLWSPQ